MVEFFCAFKCMIGMPNESHALDAYYILWQKPGDRVEVDELIAQIETDKVTIDVASPEAGVIQKLVAKEGETVEPGTKIAVISKSAEAVTQTAPQEKAAPETPPPAKKESEKNTNPYSKGFLHFCVYATLLTRLCSQLLCRFVIKVPMTRLRKRVAARLKDSQNTFAMLTTFNEVDMTNLMKLRSDYKDAFVEKHGVKLGFMSGFVKLKKSIDEWDLWEKLRLWKIDEWDLLKIDGLQLKELIAFLLLIGLPLPLPLSKGLVVPVIRDAGSMNFAEIEKEINTLAMKANDGSISIDEMAGGTFTISNGGVYGSLLSTPIINPPQSAILGMHSIVNRPMVVEGNIVPRPMMYIALTYDHRLIDGREAVFFLRRVKDVVEDPRRLLLDV
ncbi:hypothetical protein GH714_017501 [Hevea brasiliensis]|uniref:Dihydrolipoamide acetyltransferase component of pyruvate dehydrogenase complex n=1 Tax=Hevea brasiliensis TaxID=3981 RepID=A0A6A6KVL8_HEVBR|nr:hypothetical protein GH714_017501 [Hevea brasiliensis]